MKRLVPGITLAIALTVALVTSASAAQDPFLAKLVGTWIGRGAMVQSADAKAERLYCKVTNTLSEDGTTLNQAGRCSLASASGPIDGHIKAGADNTYSGTLASIGSRGPATLAGGLADNADKKKVLRLNTEYIDKLSGAPVKAVNTLELLPDGGYSLTATRTNPADGKEYTSSKVVFSAN